MTSGPDHYREAERLIGVATEFAMDSVASSARELAQVHATLALAAATALRMAHEYFEIADDVQAWAEATGTPTGNPDDDGMTCQFIYPDEARLGRQIVDVQLPEPMRLCIDEDCPQCGWAERWFEPDRQLFGCAKCDYTSKERAA
jgi:hypothetical protein